MDERADLHLHTTASDGRWSPEQLIDEVRQAGIGLFAVTDHDSLGSLAEISELVRGSGLCFLPGVELSARLDGQVYHLLAYGFDTNDSDLVALVAENNARLALAGDVIVHLLADDGYPVSVDEYAAYSWDRRRGGWKGRKRPVPAWAARESAACRSSAPCLWPPAWTKSRRSS